MRPDRSIERVYLHRAPIDMRKQMDGLAILAKEAMRLDRFSGSLFVFVNRRHNKLKILLWERNGFIVWYKRLERDRFHWPKRQDETVLNLTGEQLNFLIDGYDVWRMKAHAPLTFSALG
jgi:transposase